MAEFEPMLASTFERPFSAPGWLFETKLDGIRALVARTGDAVSIRSRSGRELAPGYPELAEALAAQRCDDFVADGEIVAYENGRTSFGRLQERMHLLDPDQARATGVYVELALFDLLRLYGRDTRGLELVARKHLLSEALALELPLRLVAHEPGANGEALYATACEQGLEGVLAKRADSTYRAGRSRDWLKLKCTRAQEVVIGGFTAPRGSRTDLGALLVGYHDADGALLYAGKVGSGFDGPTLARLGDTLREIERDESPFQAFRPVPPETRWVAPTLVAQVAFGEWTRTGRLRHPRFRGLREDKRPQDVVREPG